MRYHFATDTWSRGADAPREFNHFQATLYQGLVWVVGSFNTNDFPTETSEPNVWVYDPAADRWIRGPPIPTRRRRGGAGLVVYQDQFYVVGGNTKGHDGGSVGWLDRYDPRTGQWQVLEDAPRARDHFSAQVADGKMYCVGGRATDYETDVFANEVPHVDVYSFVAGTWTTLAARLPRPRAAPATAFFAAKILVMGGETHDSGDALARVDALDPATGTFSQLASMRHGRHGTQAIVSGPGVIVTAGSPYQGGASQTNMEAYSRYRPEGNASTPGVLRAKWAGGVPVQPNGTSYNLTLYHAGGSTGVVVQSFGLSGTDAADYALVAPPSVPRTAPFLLGAGESVTLAVRYKGAKASGAVADLTVRYSGGRTLLFPVFLGGSCRASGVGACTSRDRCCGRACVARKCRACRLPRLGCARTSECCPGLRCRRRRCLP
jgi:hypothetical protein